MIGGHHPVVGSGITRYIPGSERGKGVESSPHGIWKQRCAVEEDMALKPGLIQSVGPNEENVAIRLLRNHPAQGAVVLCLVPCRPDFYPGRFWMERH